jgi:hypothetical protein
LECNLTAQALSNLFAYRQTKSVSRRVVLLACRISRFEERLENVWSVSITDSDAAIYNFEYDLVLVNILRINFVVTADTNAVAVLRKLEGVRNQV